MLATEVRLCGELCRAGSKDRILVAFIDLRLHCLPAVCDQYPPSLNSITWYCSDLMASMPHQDIAEMKQIKPVPPLKRAAALPLGAQ